MLLRRVTRSLVAAALTACVAVAASAGAATQDPSTTALLLVDQNATVSPSVPGQPATFTIGVAIRGPEPPGAEVVLTFYDQLHTTGGFEQTLTNSPTGRLHEVAAQPVSALRLVDGAYQITTTILEGQSTPQGSSAVGLDTCSVGLDTCSGVYPVVVGLESDAGTIVSHFTTYLTYVETKSANPLVFSWVVPVGSPVEIRPGASLSNALAPPSKSRLDHVAALLGTLSANRGVEESVAPSPMTVEAMAAGTSENAKDALASLRAFAAANPRRLLLQPYVPVNLSELSGAGSAGLVTEIKGQHDRAKTVLDSDLVGLADDAQPVSAVWVARGGVGPAITAGMRAWGASELVLPDTDLPAATEEAHATWAQPFQLDTSRGNVAAAVSDSQLTPYFTPNADDQALAAYQLLANLAMIHFELPGYRPGVTRPRGVIAVPPADWDPDPAFVAALVNGLSTNPVVTTATLDQFFTEVPPGANGASTTRHLGSGSAGTMSSSQAAAIAAARRQISGFANAVQKRPVPAVVNQLEDVLLASESSELSPRSQRAGLSTFEHHLSGEVGEITVLASTITLTARTATLPITIVSSAGYGLTARLTLSSDKLQFPEGSTRTVYLDHPTNSTNVEVRARTTGDLPLSFTLTSLDGGLVIARGQFTVRSTATSIWGIVLTLVAAVVLFGWWARTWRRGRQIRRAARAARASPQ